MSNVIHALKVFSGADGLWYVRIFTANNEILFVSEGHKNKGDAAQIANAVSMQLETPVLVEIDD